MTRVQKWERIWWRHQMETFSGLLSLCAGISPIAVFVDLRLNKRFSEQSIPRWFETPLGSLWRHCNEVAGTPRNPTLKQWSCIDGSVQERRNSSASAMELRLSCINTSITLRKRPRTEHGTPNRNPSTCPCTGGPFTNMDYKVWDEITYLFPIFNGCTVKFWKINQWFHPTFYWACDYLSRLRLNWIHASKSRPWSRTPLAGVLELF